MDKKSYLAVVAALAFVHYAPASIAAAPTPSQDELNRMRQNLDTLIQNFNHEHDAIVAANQKLSALEQQAGIPESHDQASTNDTAQQQPENTSGYPSSNNPEITSNNNGSEPANPTDTSADTTNNTQGAYLEAPEKQGSDQHDTAGQETNEANSDATAANNQNSSEKKEADQPQGLDVFLENQNTVLTNRLTVEADIQYTSFNRRQVVLDGFLALDSIFLGDITIDRVRSNTLELDLSARYRLTEKAQISVYVPWLYRSTKFTHTGVNGASTTLDSQLVTASPRMGDTEVTLYYQLCPETLHFPSFIFSLQGTLPTGVTPFGILTKNVANDNLTTFIVPTDIPTGNGMFALSAGLNFSKTIDPAVIFGNISFQRNFDRHFTNIGTTLPKTPGEVNLGDSITYGLGIAYALNERTSISLAFTQELTDQAQMQPKHGKWSTLINSDSQAASLIASFTYGFTDHFATIAQVQAGLNEDAADFIATLRFPYTFG